MSLFQTGLLCAASGLALAAGGCLAHEESAQGDTPAAAEGRRDLADLAIGQWSNPSALAARLLIEKYGTPDKVLYERLVWENNGPWRRTVVRNVRPFDVEGADRGMIEQTIDEALTPAQAAAVAAAFGDRVRFDRRKNQLTARSDREALNYLRLNLAHDVVVGTLRPAQARDSYARDAAFEKAGKVLPSMLGLTFARAGPGVP